MELYHYLARASSCEESFAFMASAAVSQGYIQEKEAAEKSCFLKHNGGRLGEEDGGVWGDGGGGGKGSA